LTASSSPLASGEGRVRGLERDSYFSIGPF